MKKLFGWILVISMLVSLCGCGTVPEAKDPESPVVEDSVPNIPESTIPDMPENPIEEFKYEMKNGEVIITGYIGTARKIRIPAEINERPVTTIGEEAFTGYDLTYIYIPEGVTTIQEDAFRVCECLEEIVFPDSLKVIGEAAFEFCKALKTVKLPENLTKLGSDAFFGCSSLKEIFLPASLSKIEESSFGFCEALETIHFSEGLTDICSGAFGSCKSLSAVNLPESLTRLGINSFSNCDNLKTLKIPANTHLDIVCNARNIPQHGGYTMYSVSCPLGITNWYSGFSSGVGEGLATEPDVFGTVLLVAENSIAHQQLRMMEYKVMQYQIV